MIKDFSKPTNFNGNPNDLNNLYPEDKNFGTKDISKNYKPIFSNNPLNQNPNADQQQNQYNQPQENLYRPTVPASNFQYENYSQNYSQQIPNRFDVNIESPKIQPSFNKDIGYIGQPASKLQKFKTFFTKRWKVILLIFVLMSIVGVGSWLVYLNNQTVPGPFENVEVVFTAPTESPSGIANTWKIEIKNLENVDLLNVELRLQFDSKFRFERAITPNPSHPRGNVFSFARIDAANKDGGTSSVLVQFEGILTGRVDEETFMSGVLIYTPEPLINYPNNRQEIKLERKTTVITKPLVTATINPDNIDVESDTETIIKIVFENLSNRDLNNLRLKVDYPNRDVFEYISSELILSNSSSPRVNPTDGNNIWDIETLPESSRQELYIRGKMKGPEFTEHRFGLDISIKRADNTYQSIFNTSRDIRIVPRPLVLSTFIVGKQANPVFSPGETLTFQIDYKNQSKNPINNIEIVASINDPAGVLDFTTLRFRNDIIGNEQNKNIRWGGQSANFLASMPPGLEGNIQFTINVKKQEDMVNPSLNQGSYVLIPKVEAKADNINPVIVQGPVYRASGFVSFSNSVSFTEHPGDSTKRLYKVRWIIKTGQNAVKNVKIRSSSTLPSTSWQSDSINPKEFSQNLKYNATNGQIIFEIDRLEALLGSQNKPAFFIEFEWEVSMQAGKFENIPIMRQANFEAVDEFTGEVYKMSLPAITTSQVR